MKVVIVTENFLPKIDGVTRTLARLLAHLQEQGHQALLFGPETGMKEYCQHELVGTFGIPFPPYPEIKLNFYRPYFIKKLQEFQPDVIHFVDPVWLGFQILFIVQKYFPDTPLVSSYHTNLATYCKLFGYGFLVNTMWRWNRFLHNKCDLIACPSNSTAKVLSDHGFKTTRLWPRGADITLLNPSKRSSRLRQEWVNHRGLDEKDVAIILYVGRISWEKNLKLLVAASKKLDISKVHIVLVGHGPAQKEIARALSGHSVTFTGYLSDEPLYEAYASADIFAFPSFTETFGQVVLEALASGTPVVGLNSEGVCDLVQNGKTGLLLNCDSGKLHSERSYQSFKSQNGQETTLCDSDALAESYAGLLNSLVENKKLRMQMSVNAVESIRGRTWTDAMEKMVDTYKEAILLKNDQIKQRHLPSPILKSQILLSSFDLSWDTLDLSRMKELTHSRFAEWLLFGSGTNRNRHDDPYRNSFSASPPWTRSYINCSDPNELGFKLLVLLYAIYLVFWIFQRIF